MWVFPTPVSSAGVPNNLTVPLIDSRRQRLLDRRSRQPVLAVPKPSVRSHDRPSRPARGCVQAPASCDRPGSASNPFRRDIYDDRPAGAVSLRKDLRRHARDASLRPGIRSRAAYPAAPSGFTSSSPVEAQLQMLRLTRLSVDDVSFQPCERPQALGSDCAHGGWSLFSSSSNQQVEKSEKKRCVIKI